MKCSIFDVAYVAYPTWFQNHLIPCLDVRDNQVVKGIKFRNHRIIGDISPLAREYSVAGADELVFYDDRKQCPNTSLSCLGE